MSRNKKLNEDRFIYCGNIKCQNTQCLRNHIYEPWNVIIYEKKYKFDKIESELLTVRKRKN